MFGLCKFVLAAAIVIAAALDAESARAQTDPLPSWSEGASKRSITDFVLRVTEQGTPGFVPPKARIAVFDNDGTLWAEQPIFFQVQFAIDRIKAMAAQHPEWKRKEPFKSLLAGDTSRFSMQDEKALLSLLFASHSGINTDEFSKLVADWLASARHPRFNRAYTELVYQPMVELLAYLRANGFKTYIVSGGGVDFMRVWGEKAYGIPPAQVIGSSAVSQFKLLPDGKAVLTKTSKVLFVDDGPGKPVGISLFIGEQPILAFGNSDGDLQMLQYTAAGSGPRLLGLIHHTDSVREYAYDRQWRPGKLDKALDEAARRGWTVVDMKQDWIKVFAFE